MAAGFADFPLLAYHFQKVGSVAPEWIPILDAIAMGSDALAALVFGRLYDRSGMGILLVGTLLAIPVAPLVFFGNFAAALLASALWGIGIGMQKSIMKASVATMSPVERGAAAFGTFNLSFGLFWFAGSALIGWLYGVSLMLLVSFSITAQILAVVLLARVVRAAPEAGEADLGKP